jgi:hypothetical protein
VDTKTLRDDFEPDMPTKPLQPLLRFWRSDLLDAVLAHAKKMRFQPFLRFYGVMKTKEHVLEPEEVFQPFLRF